MRYGLAAFGAVVTIIPIWFSETASAGEIVNYSYDALGRFSASNTSGTVNDNQVQVLEYDAAGNRANYSFNNGSAGIPTISIGNANVPEGGVLQFPVTLSSATTVPVSVQFATANGTAISGADYIATSGTLTLPAGQTNAVVNVQTLDDPSVEPDETLTVSISSPNGATIATSQGVGTIVNNDTAWTSNLSAATILNGRGPSSVGYISGSGGSMSVTAYNVATVSQLYSLSGSIFLQMKFSGSVSPLLTWTSITVPGVGTLNRTAASYTLGASTSPQTATWKWTISGTVSSGIVTINP